MNLLKKKLIQCTLPECLANTFPSSPAVKGTAPHTLLKEVLALMLSNNRAELILNGVFSRCSACSDQSIRELLVNV